jgi:membrane carboxypeptidase/penicillin-binding protein
VPEKPLVRPPGVISARINRDTGRLAEANDPQAMQEYFIEGTLDGAGGEGEDGGALPKPALPENLGERLF